LSGSEINKGFNTYLHADAPEFEYVVLLTELR